MNIYNMYITLMVGNLLGSECHNILESKCDLVPRVAVNNLPRCRRRHRFMDSQTRHQVSSYPHILASNLQLIS